MTLSERSSNSSTAGEYQRWEVERFLIQSEMVSERLKTGDAGARIRVGVRMLQAGTVRREVCQGARDNGNLEAKMEREAQQTSLQF